VSARGFEYLRRAYIEWPSTENLNSLGAEGWELVSLVPFDATDPTHGERVILSQGLDGLVRFVAYFKRGVPDADDRANVVASHSVGKTASSYGRLLHEGVKRGIFSEAEAEEIWADFLQGAGIKFPPVARIETACWGEVRRGQKGGEIRV
jgi:hypothetical protein